MTKILIPMLLLLFCGANVRAANPSELSTFKAFNNLQIEYAVLLPKGFDPNMTYPAILSFSTYKYNQEKTLTMVDGFWDGSTLEDYIVIVPTSPKGQDRGWISHPAHHALVDFLKMINSKYKIQNDKFHLLGFDEGCIPAQTYTVRELFVSLTTVSSEEWSRFDADWYNKMSKHKMPTLLIYGLEDASGVELGERVKRELSKRGVDTQLIIETGNRKSLPSARGNQVLKQLTAFIAQ